MTGTCGRKIGSWKRGYRNCIKERGHAGRCSGTPPKPESDSPSGTCQVCFRQQKLPSNMALHGYKRPGEGYIIGKCWGSHERPFEESCEVTKKYLAELRSIEDRSVDGLEKLKVATSLSYSPGRFYHRGRYYDMPSFTMTPEGNAQANYTYLYTFAHMGQIFTQRVGLPSFEDVRANKVRDASARLNALRGHIKFVEDKIASWKPMRLDGKKWVVA